MIDTGDGHLKQRVAAAFILLLLGLGWLSLGVYTDSEFGGLHVFLKHRLYPRFFFYSPVGERDYEPSTEAERRAEQDYREFVDFKGGRNRSWMIIN